MREEPKDAEYYAWETFNKWADEHGVPEHPEDWPPYWELWKAAYAAAMNGDP